MKKIFSILLSLFFTFSAFAKGFYTEDDIGKIVLKDGSLVTVNQYDKASYQAIGIVWNVAKDGSCFWAIGINTIEAKWASSKAAGYLGRMQELEGLEDGSKALKIVKKADPKGAKNLKENYPALYFASIYGKKYNTGKFTEGWYIPTLAELGSLDPNIDPWKDLKKPATTTYTEIVEIADGENPYKTKDVPVEMEYYINGSYRERAEKAFKLFNDEFPYKIRCSDSNWFNDDGSHYDEKLYPELPSQIATNSVSCIRSGLFTAFGHKNDFEYSIIVMRKFK